MAHHLDPPPEGRPWHGVRSEDYVDLDQRVCVNTLALHLATLPTARDLDKAKRSRQAKLARKENRRI